TTLRLNFASGVSFMDPDVLSDASSVVKHTEYNALHGTSRSKSGHKAEACSGPVNAERLGI
ncbi:MAG: hypothetical protein VKJ85_10550, partial [Prochlorothrix sp.]|nr:hypothetical protein [Prochlorothrix sp.]